MLARIASTYVLLAAALAAGCASAPEPAPTAPDPAAEAAPEAAPAAPEARELAEATELESPAGATFQAPAGWFVTRMDGALRLEPPERDMNMWLVDVEGDSTEAAIETAWQRVDPSFDREPDEVVTPPAQGGWDELRQVTYETAADEGRVLLATARAKGDTTYVALLDGPVAAVQRRGAHINQIIGSQKPAGLEEESFADAEAVPLDEARAGELGVFIEQAMNTLDIPGAAIAVVQGGEVVFERGYGVRDTGGEPVTPETAFMIGSTTKSLTSLMLAVGVDDGAFAWTTPVTELLPSFSLADAETTGKIQLRHTMCACTGLPRQDMEFLFEFGGVTPKERLAELGTMKPTTGFGETFQYSNALVSAGGFAAARAMEQDGSLMDAYLDAIRGAVFGPLGMDATMFRIERATAGSHALPHGRGYDGSYARLPLSYENAVLSVAPAGGAWSTVRDLARYMQLELSGGALPDGERLLSEEALMERRVPRVQIDEDTAYGLALMISRDRDLLTVGHGGNTLGFTTAMTFFPEHDLGVAIVANAQAANAFSGAVQRRLVELVLGGRPEAADDLAFAAKRTEESSANLEAKLSDPFEGDWAEPLFGTYESDALGQLVIERDGDELVVDAGEWRIAARKFTSGGSDALMLVGAPFAGLSFLPQEDGSLVLDGGQQRYTFARQGGDGD